MFFQLLGLPAAWKISLHIALMLPYIPLYAVYVVLLFSVKAAIVIKAKNNTASVDFGSA